MTNFQLIFRSRRKRAEEFSKDSLQSRNCLRRIESKRFREFEKLDHVHAALSAFQSRHKGLVLAQSGSKLALGHTGSLAQLDQEIDQGAVPLRSERFAQSDSRKLSGFR
jgi:hypothetical protein